MNGPPVKLLLIEDDEDDYIITRDLLAESGFKSYHLDWVSSFEAAWEAVHRDEYDVYLIDYRLGAHTGLELLKQALLLGCQAPIILLTGLGDHQIDEEAMRLGAADYLVKGQITPPLIARSINHSIERKKAERQLRENEEQYRLLFEQSPHPLWVVDCERFSLLAVNQAAIRAYGYQREEFLQMRLHDLGAEDELWNPEQMRRFGSELALIASDLPQTCRHRAKDGRIITVELTWKQILFRGCQAALILANDITQRLDLEAQLRQSQKMESVGTLAGGIAHDFNNILAIITSHASLLRQQIESSSASAKSLDAVEKAALRGAGLVKQILTFARKTDICLQPVDANLAVQELTPMLSETFPRTINFVFDLEPDLPRVKADPNQLHQSLLNLCVNARDAMPSGGTITVRTRRVSAAQVPQNVPSLQDRDYLLISISDTGTGMDEMTRTRIFEPFFTTKSTEKGTGLGLAVVYGVVRSHQGFIDVVTQPGRGTTFLLYLPALPIGEVFPDKPSRLIQESNGGTETLLLVEDEELLLDLMKTVLEEKGYTIHTATDGLEAVEKFAAHASQTALALVDMGLPRLGGWEACLQMRRINPKVRVVLASGYLEPELKHELLHSGAADFIQKPYIPEEVIGRIRKVLDDRRNQESETAG
jgi:two-component system, cell cycle sensor histidine kinase and response regulator CckA